MKGIIRVTRKTDLKPAWIMVTHIEGVIGKKDESAMIWLSSSGDSFIETLESPETVITLIELSEKETPPRILSLDELRIYPAGTVLWMDRKTESGDVYPMYPVCFDGFGPGIVDKDVESFLFPEGTDPVEDYGKGFVLWTGRATAEQRKEAVWNG